MMALCNEYCHAIQNVGDIAGDEDTTARDAFVASMLRLLPRMYITANDIPSGIGGFFLEGTAMQIMFIPVLLPIVQAAGINEIAFGVTVICNIAIGNLTPPVGVCLYVAANSSHAKVEGIIKNIVPFVLMAMVDIGILMVFPQLITWIPDLMH